MLARLTLSAGIVLSGLFTALFLYDASMNLAVCMLVSVSTAEPSVSAHSRDNLRHTCVYNAFVCSEHIDKSHNSSICLHVKL